MQIHHHVMQCTWVAMVQSMEYIYLSILPLLVLLCWMHQLNTMQVLNKVQVLDEMLDTDSSAEELALLAYGLLLSIQAMLIIL